MRRQEQPGRHDCRQADHALCPGPPPAAVRACGHCFGAAHRPCAHLAANLVRTGQVLGAPARWWVGACTLGTGSKVLCTSLSWHPVCQLVQMLLSAFTNRPSQRHHVLSPWSLHTRTPRPCAAAGNIPGSKFRKPFICPMDHVLDIEGGWFPRRFDEQYFGPHVDWREYTFLQNPRMPKEVNASRLAVTVCEQGAAGCSDGSGPGTISEVGGHGWCHGCCLQHIIGPQPATCCSQQPTYVFLLCRHTLDTVAALWLGLAGRRESSSWRQG
jgi:hypothetical protein